MVSAVGPQPVLGSPAADPPAALFDEATVLHLFPTVIRRVGAGECSLIRIGCRVVTVVSTSDVGVRAARLLAKGETVGRTKAVIAGDSGCALADLTPILTALYKARMVRAINGSVVCDETTSAWRVLWHRCEWRAMGVRRAFMRLVINFLPLRLAYSILYLLKPKWPHRSRVRVTAQAMRNLDRAFAGSLPAARIRRIARDFTREHVQRALDIEFLNALPELRVAHWLRRSCTFSGLEHLDAALAQNKGVLLSTFHFSAAHLVGVLMWLRGYSFTGEGGFAGENRGRSLPFENPELALQLGGCGQVKWFSRFTFDSSLAILRVVRQGGMGLVAPDGIIDRPGADITRYFGHGAAQYRRAHALVPFLGGQIEANTGVSWIYRECEAPLIPVKLVRLSNTRFQMLVQPELRLDRRGTTREIAAELYRALEREVCTEPAAWAYWRILDRLWVPSSPNASAEAAPVPEGRPGRRPLAKSVVASVSPR